MKRFLQAGRLNSPRGLKGELRFECWCDSIEFLMDIKKLYLDEKGEKFLEVQEFRPTVSTVVFKGYTERTTAAALTGRTLFFDRNDVVLPEGVCYNDDLIGLGVYGFDSGDLLGNLTSIDEIAGKNYYTVKGENGEYFIPAVDEYIREVNLETGIKVKLIEELKVE